MAHKKRKKAAGKLLVLKSGEKYAVTGETWKYYICNGTQFKKDNPAIDEVIEPEIIAEIQTETIEETTEEMEAE